MLPVPAEQFHGQPGKTAKTEFPPTRFRQRQKLCVKCYLQFWPNILTVPSAARKLSEICQKMLKTIPAQTTGKT
jgi:hypothetical protein